jgi:uncharacterized protein YbbC (DUF1343 family)
LGALFASAAWLPATRGWAAEASRARVQVGLERLLAERGARLRGRRLGLVVHAASQTVTGQHAIDALRGLGLNLVRLFSPEHGLRGLAAAGEPVASGVDTESGLPLVSLYGTHTQPRPEELRDLDVLVIDLQDVGVRFYTYASTLLLCLEAAAAVDLEVLVLDRPNPLGGLRVEGPPSAPRTQVAASLVNRTPGPLVHGLTLGELARLANAALPRAARLDVLALQGWKRAQLWQDTGRPWVPPSPNLRSPEAALLYPGTCLLEATNVSEGRGSEAPFLLIGAPWLTPAALARVERQLASTGVRLARRTFVPRAAAAAPTPKHRDLLCRGWRLGPRDARTFSPWRLGVSLLHALQHEPGFAWRADGEALTRLLGSPRLLAALRRGDTPEAILDSDAPDVAVWRQTRAPFLLYS